MSDMMDGMWDTVGDMGSMMDDGMGDMMDGLMGGGGPETTGSASGRGEVTIEDFRFEPPVFTVTVGTAVKWTNEDGAPHTSTARDGSFDTGQLDQGESGEVTFDAAGIFDYYCVFHPWMEARVVVAASAHSITKTLADLTLYLLSRFTNVSLLGLATPSPGTTTGGTLQTV